MSIKSKIVVERRRLIDATSDKIRLVLGDFDQLQRLLPHVQRIAVQPNGEARARVTAVVNLGGFGLQQVAGEARLLENSLRFVAVQPVEIDARWSFQARGTATEVIAYLAIEPGGKLGMLGRFMPRRPIEARIGQELETSLSVLADLVKI